MTFIGGVPINGCQPEFVRHCGKKYFATADYGGVRPDILLSRSIYSAPDESRSRRGDRRSVAGRASKTTPSPKLKTAALERAGASQRDSHGQSTHDKSRTSIVVSRRCVKRIVLLVERVAGGLLKSMNDFAAIDVVNIGALNE